MTIDRHSLYLTAADAYCRAKFDYDPRVYSNGALGASAHLARDARDTADEHWLRAVVNAVVDALVAEVERTPIDDDNSIRPEVAEAIGDFLDRGDRWRDYATQLEAERDAAVKAAGATKGSEAVT